MSVLYRRVIDGHEIIGCNCECHVVGSKYRVMHCAPCCELCGFEYINTDGSLNEAALNEAAQANVDYFKELMRNKSQ